MSESHPQQPQKEAPRLSWFEVYL